MRGASKKVCGSAFVSFRTRKRFSFSVSLRLRKVAILRLCEVGLLGSQVSARVGAVFSSGLQDLQIALCVKSIAVW